VSGASTDGWFPAELSRQAFFSVWALLFDTSATATIAFRNRTAGVKPSFRPPLRRISLSLPHQPPRSERQELPHCTIA